MCAAVGYDMLKSINLLSTDDISFFAVGFIVSLITAVVAIKFFMQILKRYSLKPFAWYRIILGAIVLFLV